MAKKETKSLDQDKYINNLLSFINNGMDDIYKDTYFTTNQSEKELDILGNDIDDTIDTIINKNSPIANASNISKLIQKSKMVQNQDDTIKMEYFENLFADPSNTAQLAALHRENTYIKEYNNQIDTICKYFPKLDQTVELKIENILSADHFTKDFLTVSTNGVDSDSRQENLERIKKIRSKYKLDAKYEEWLRSIIKYGEKFVSIVPYDKAINRLLKVRNNSITESISVLSESSSIREVMPESLERLFKGEIKINIHKSGLIEDAVIDAEKATRVLLSESNSLNEEFIIEDTENRKVDKIRNTREVSKGVECDFEIPTSDGLLMNNRSNKNEGDLNINGAIVTELDSEKVKPVWLGNICVGYYYIDVAFDQLSTTQIQNKFSMFNTVANRNNTFSDNSGEMMFLNNLSKEISNYIDISFINSNVDLKDEIYLVLKNAVDNGNLIRSINVTFIPPEDMVHMYFKMDPITHRGISELDGSLIPATLYIGLYLSNVIGIMTRGQDKRIYYIKQNVETNTAKTMLNVVNQIKKNNFNFRSMNTVYNVLDVVGKYNDYIIPLSKSGDAPIQFDIMSGQNITINEDLYNLFEEQALNATGVTKELLDAVNSTDYAIQVSMSNTKFLKKILKKQGLYIPYIDRTMSMIYLYEYKEPVNLNVTLPAPLILNLNNINQMINANNDYINYIIESDSNLSKESDKVKAVFKSKMSRYNLSSHISYDMVDKFIHESKVEAALLNDEE